MGKTPNENGVAMSKQAVEIDPVNEAEEDMQYSACDAELFIFKDLQHHMSHPFFSLSKRPCNRTIKYESGHNWIKIKPSATGRATIYDKDILVYIISQLIQKDKNGEPISRHVTINPSELLKAINRGTGGKDYKALGEALDRLEGTRIQTNIVQGGEVETSAYGMVDTYTTLRKDDKIDGRMLSLKVSLSNQLFNSMKTKKELLTVNPDYFKLSKPIEKKIYEIARKHVGRKSAHSINTSTLLIKSGSVGSIRDMRRSVKKLIASHQAEKTFPDYDVQYSADKDQVTFTQKDKWWQKSEADIDFTFPEFHPRTFEAAKEIAPDICVYHLQSEFEKWVRSKLTEFKLDKKSLSKTYLDFCRTKQLQKVSKEAGQVSIF